MSALQFPGIKLDDESIQLRRNTDALIEKVEMMQALMGCTPSEEGRLKIKQAIHEVLHTIAKAERQLTIL